MTHADAVLPESQAAEDVAGTSYGDLFGEELSEQEDEAPPQPVCAVS